jgi:hypothetical protein
MLGRDGAQRVGLVERDVGIAGVLEQQAPGARCAPVLGASLFGHARRERLR